MPAASELLMKNASDQAERKVLEYGGSKREAEYIITHAFVFLYDGQNLPVFRKVAQNLYNFRQSRIYDLIVTPHLKDSVVGDVLDSMVSKACCQDQYDRFLIQKTLALDDQ
ncbi:hypothetical protein WISP_146695 [Willisornis vidua]|uniref:Uncharacterized protein n=1 Tax=Willisornis vidua TaxID=1566151 RepID=A0ABQ9CLN9_9PASS|nr:hypothetical protein WISP_146695 [Willisornis vidua]